MLIEIKGHDNPYIANFEQQKDFYSGAKGTNIIEVIWPKIENSFITLSFENVRKKVFGPVYCTNKVEENDVYNASFNITNSNILVPGDIQITVYLNITDTSRPAIEKRYCLGRVVGVVKESSFAGDDIIITNVENPTEIIHDFEDKIETLNILVNNMQVDHLDARLSIIERNVVDVEDTLNETVQKVNNLKPIRTVDSIPENFETGEYLFLELK